MAKGNVDYAFKGGLEYTDVAEVKYAHVNEPDSKYERYSVVLRLDPDADSTKALLADTLAFENMTRAAAGLDPVEIPGNWTKHGKPSKDDDGFWLVQFALNQTNSKGQSQRPGIVNVYGDPDPEVTIWSSDLVVVSFSIACWTKPHEGSAKYFLKDVQQVKPGANRGGAAPSKFQNRATPMTGDDVDTASDDGTGEDIPF